MVEQPLGRVGLSKTAFQPMDSRANVGLAQNASPCRAGGCDRIVFLADVAGLFYSDDELSIKEPQPHDVSRNS